MSLTQEIHDSAQEIGRAMAAEARVECVGLEDGTMRSTVKFHDTERQDMLLDAYMGVIEFLGDRAVGYFDAPQSFGFFEEVLFETLSINGALDNRAMEQPRFPLAWVD